MNSHLPVFLSYQNINDLRNIHRVHIMICIPFCAISGIRKESSVSRVADIFSHSRIIFPSSMNGMLWREVRVKPAAEILSFSSRPEWLPQ